MGEAQCGPGRVLPAGPQIKAQDTLRGLHPYPSGPSTLGWTLPPDHPAPASPEGSCVLWLDLNHSKAALTASGIRDLDGGDTVPITPHSRHPRKATHTGQNGLPIPGHGSTQEKRDPAAERCLREFIIGTRFRCHGTFLEKTFQVFREARSCRAGPTR